MMDAGYEDIGLASFGMPVWPCNDERVRLLESWETKSKQVSMLRNVAADTIKKFMNFQDKHYIRWSDV